MDGGWTDGWRAGRSRMRRNIKNNTRSDFKPGHKLHPSRPRDELSRSDSVFTRRVNIVINGRITRSLCDGEELKPAGRQNNNRMHFFLKGQDAAGLNQQTA